MQARVWAEVSTRMEVIREFRPTLETHMLVSAPLLMSFLQIRSPLSSWQVEQLAVIVQRVEFALRLLKRLFSNFSDMKGCVKCFYHIIITRNEGSCPQSSFQKRLSPTHAQDPHHFRRSGGWRLCIRAHHLLWQVTRCARPNFNYRALPSAWTAETNSL